MITYRDATPSDLTEVARLHRLCFKGTFISSLGPELIAHYYLEYLEEGGPFVLAFDNCSLIGFCMGYYSGSTARDSFIRRNRVTLAIRICLLCLSLNKNAWQRVWKFVVRKIRRSSPVGEVMADADLLSICLLPEYRGHGISNCMLGLFEKVLSDDEKKDLTLSVYTANCQAISFYRKEGFSIVSEEGDVYRMYKLLQK
jgi:ribosomal protein S18 acetylase RimI-like enzyme